MLRSEQEPRRLKPVRRQPYPERHVRRDAGAGVLMFWVGQTRQQKLLSMTWIFFQSHDKTEGLIFVHVFKQVIEFNRSQLNGIHKIKSEHLHKC